jgi:hypothetical protein
MYDSYSGEQSKLTPDPAIWRSAGRLRQAQILTDREAPSGRALLTPLRGSIHVDAALVELSN